MMTNNILFVVLFIGCVHSVKLPDSIPRCNAGDNKCILDAANKAFQFLLPGYKPFKSRSVLPFKFEKAIISDSPSLKVALINGEIYNIDTTELTLMHVTPDWKDWKARATLNGTLITDYDVTGRILVLPVSGKGKCRIDLTQVVCDYHAKVSFVERDGKQYFNVLEDSMHMEASNMHFQFDNLFNGDKVLGDNLNAFLNENWRDVKNELNGGFEALILSILHAVMDPLLQNVPVEELILS